MNKYDLAIIGSGPGGYVAALHAAHLKKKVCIIEKHQIGGTCLNSGCIPTKAYVASRDALHKVRSAVSFGIDVQNISVNFQAIFERKNSIVKEVRTTVAKLLKGNGVDIIKGTGELVDQNTMSVKDDDSETKVQADRIIIATGSIPISIPSINIDHKNIITSRDALKMASLPEEMVILGGGIIGCEFASIFAAFGTKITIVELANNILPTIDPQMANIIKASFKESGIKVMTGVKVENVVVTDGIVQLSLNNGEKLTTPKLLVSIGRAPNTNGLGLAKLGIKLDGSRIAVDKNNQTNIKNIYAIGDVTAGPMLAHKASYDGVCAVHNAFGLPFNKQSYSNVPSVVFTAPEVACVGISEPEAKASGIEYKCGRFSYASSSKALCMGEQKGLIKILAKKEEDIIIGAAICGAHASDLIYGLAAAINLELKAKDVSETIFAHPTLSEGIKEALEDIDGLAVHKIRG